MSYSNRTVRSTSRRHLKYGATRLAVCGLVAAVLLMTWLPSPIAAGNGSRPLPSDDLLPIEATGAEQYSPGITQAAGETPQPTETYLTLAGTFTGDLSQLPYVAPTQAELPERDGPQSNPIRLPGSMTPPAQPSAPIGPSAPAPAPLITFDGLDFATWGAGHPPDTNGDVGPTYYIQTVNTSIGIYTKTTGARAAAFTFNTFMSQGSFGNLCDTNNYGDPVVLYDSFEDRWIITDFAFTIDGSGNVINPPGAFECIAVSRTGNPVTGGWNFYSINTTGGLGDYPKLGVWPDGIYMSVNMFDYAAAGSFQNVRLYAFNKTQMYAGAANPQVVVFTAPSGEFTLLPANARLQTGTPPAGSPNYFAVVWQYLNVVSVYKFHVDWNSTSTSTFTGPFNSLTTTWWAQYNRGGPNPTTAPSPANALDTLYPRLMMQNQYSNIGGVESLWASHTVGAGNPTSNVTSAQAAVRYYQVRVTGGTVEANASQSYTYSPDTTMFRFMPSVAVDRLGNMAIGYSTANATTNPALKYAGRLYTDTVNFISQDEQTLYQGTGSQSGNCGSSACQRWGDYSTMTLDPDGCTFWYTNEYYAVNGLNDLTRIGSFRYPTCTPISSVGAITGTVIDASTSSPISGVTVTLGSRITTTNASGVYQFPNLPPGVYPNITASYPGYTSGSAGPITVTASLTTTQNFALSGAARSGCLVDTAQADFQTGTPTNCDLTSSPGNVILLNAASLDQQNATVTNSGFGFNSTNWAGQTFRPAVTGQLTQVDLDLFCSGCTGTTPNLTVSIRATTGTPAVPTGADLATATITGFSSGAGGYYSANFASPPTLTAGTTYAVIIRAVSNPSAGTYAYVCSCTSPNSNPYANGRFVTSGDSGASWSADTIAGGRDLGFRTYMQTGYASSGNFVSGLKDANPVPGVTPQWTTLSWSATAPANTNVKFQAAASNSANGPFTFVGPDSTASTYFTTTGASLSQFNGYRYLKYQAYLTTTNSITTPTLADVTVCFTNPAVATPTVTLATSQNPSLIDQSVTFTASVTSGAGTPTGLVQFKDNGANLGTAQVLNGGNAITATSALTVGTHTITADYLGNGYFNTASGTLTPNQVVTSTITWNGNADTNWFAAANWNPAALPTTGSNAVIPAAPGGNRWPTLTGTTTIYTLTVQSGAVLTLSQGITLSVNGSVSNNGALVQIKNVPASGTTEFLHLTNGAGTVDQYHGVDLTPVGAMGVTAVRINGNQSACTTNPADPIARRCYRIDPTTQVSATVRFWFTEAERNGLAANTLALWHWSPWMQVGSAANYTFSESGAPCASGGGLACWLQVTGVSAYSPFAIGSGSAPTAVQVTSMEASSPVGWLMLLTGTLLALGLGLSVVAIKRRRA